MYCDDQLANTVTTIDQFWFLVFIDILPFSCSEGDIDGDPVSCGVEKSLDCVVYSWVLAPPSCGLLFGSWRCCV